MLGKDVEVYESFLGWFTGSDVTQGYFWWWPSSSWGVSSYLLRLTLFKNQKSHFVLFFYRRFEWMNALINFFFSFFPLIMSSSPRGVIVSSLQSALEVLLRNEFSSLDLPTIDPTDTLWGTN